MTSLKLNSFYRYPVFALLLCTLQSCVVSKINPKAKNINHVYFFQDGISYTVKDDVAELKLQRKPFAIQFFNKAYTSDDGNVTRIVAVPNQKELDKLTLGLDIEETKNLESGSGLAISTKNGYNKELYINDYGHHFLRYINEEDRTVAVIGKKGDYLLFQFQVASIFDRPDFIPIAETDLKTIYFAIYADYNKNRIIDAGELTKIVLRLE